MKLAIIDLGSNTIRTVIYEIIGSKYKSILNKGIFAGIISYVKDGKMSDEGTEKIISVLNQMKEITDTCEKTICFATASLRFTENKNEVMKTVRDRTGIDIRLLSAEEEAYYDYMGLSEITEEGTAGDLGGGSCQLFSFDRSGLTYSCSLPIGGLKLYTETVAGILPAQSEIEEIKRKVQRELSLHNKLKKSKEIYMSGGSIRSILRLSGNKDFCTKKNFEDMINLCRENPNECKKLIQAGAEERLVTIIPAAVVLHEICIFLGGDMIKPVTAGVREGIVKALWAERLWELE